MTGKKIYFLSDAHLGAPVLNNNREREVMLTIWLETIRHDCETLYLLGDIFDFWFEYKTVVPKGYVRLLAKLCEFTDNGINVHFFTGNHDVWAFDYLQKECGITIHTHNETFILHQKKFFIGHGDGLSPSDKGYLFIRKAFHNRFLQRCFRLVHPDFGTYIAQRWSSHSRLKETGKIEADTYRGADNEEIEQFCRQTLKKEHYDFFIFGHRHLPLDIQLTPTSRYINTGDWVTFFSYAVFDGDTLELKYLPQ